MPVAEITQTNQYLTFRLGEETYALEIGQVREVLDCTHITRVPRMPDFMRGVINLRGSVVPVVDLRLKFGVAPGERGANTCIIIVEVAIDGARVVLGALADSVQEVLELDAAQIEPAPRMGAGISTEFIRGVGKRDGRFVIILDIDLVFSTGELVSVGDAGRTETG